MSRPTMTLKEIVSTMRRFGFRTSETVIANGIANGRYPFGTVIGTGSTGRREFEIFRVDFEKWLEERAC